MNNTEDAVIFFLFSLMGIVIGMLLGGWVGSYDPLVHPYKILDQDTANDLCKEITGIDGTIAKDWYDYNTNKLSDRKNMPEGLTKGKIACIIPTYDHNQNIQIVGGQNEW